MANEVSTKIRFKVAVTVEVDVDAWNAEYGSDETNEQIRDSVANTVREAAEYAFGPLDAVTVGEVK